MQICISVPWGMQKVRSKTSWKIHKEHNTDYGLVLFSEYLSPICVLISSSKRPRSHCLQHVILYTKKTNTNGTDHFKYICEVECNSEWKWLDFRGEKKSLLFLFCLFRKSLAVINISLKIFLKGQIYPMDSYGENNTPNKKLKEWH